MENLQHFVTFLGSWNCFVWMIISSMTIATVAVVTGLNEEPDGWKVALVGVIAFIFGAFATHIPMF